MKRREEEHVAVQSRCLLVCEQAGRQDGTLALSNIHTEKTVFSGEETVVLPSKYFFVLCFSVLKPSFISQTRQSQNATKAH